MPAGGAPQNLIRPRIFFSKFGSELSIDYLFVENTISWVVYKRFEQMNLILWSVNEKWPTSRQPKNLIGPLKEFCDNLSIYIAFNHYRIKNNYYSP